MENKKIVKIVMVRGAPAVGKSTICKIISKKLRIKYKIKSAYIEEDNFRKKMQNWNNAANIITHKNSVELIKSIIDKLIEIDDYKYIFIDGQFRYKEILDMYSSYIEENNFEKILFQFNLNIEEMIRRDTNERLSKSPDIKYLKNDIDSYIPKDTIIIDTSKQIEIIVEKILKKII